MESAPSHPLSIFKKLVFMLIPAVAFFLLAEGLIRVTGAAETCPTPEIFGSWVCDPILYFKTDPELIVRKQALNQAGFRGREFEPKAAGTFRVLTLGDSCTFGVGAWSRGLYERVPYPQRLEILLVNQFGAGKVEVLNAGTPGYNSYQGLLLMRTKLRNLEPDLVTIRFGWNDHLMGYGRLIENAFRDPENALVRNGKILLQRTAVYAFASRMVLEVQALAAGEVDFDRTLPTEWVPNMSVQDYKTALRRTAELASSRGARVWFIAAPDAFLTPEHLARYEALPEDSGARLLLTLSGLTSFRQVMEIHRSYTAAMREVAAELGAIVIDMDEIYRQHSDEELFPMDDTIHPTQSGYDLEARTLYDRFIAEGLIGS